MKTPTRQNGATLLVAMIMLVLITLIVINTVNIGSGSIQTVGNMQSRTQALSAAEEALQEVISGTTFFKTPKAVFTTPCNGSYTAKCIDLNEDAKPDITVTLDPVPSCVQARVVNNAELNMNVKSEADCAMQGDQMGFGRGGATDASACARSVWEIQAVATDEVTKARAEATQGVAVIIDTDKVETSCSL